jgi:predicted RNA-binding Zn-ribbon protein involved in translation (DUF1610 family)
MTDETQSAARSQCPTCGSDSPEKFRARTSTGRWIPWWPSQEACRDPWHSQAETPQVESAARLQWIESLAEECEQAAKYANDPHVVINWRAIIAKHETRETKMRCPHCGASYVEFHMCRDTQENDDSRKEGDL